ncbi:MAG TPA: alpha/beta fold hydrolase [Acidimicrobiales bacterium]|jgi:dienelactone hydrolase
MTGRGDGWRRRFLAANLTFPEWAVEAPDRLVYASDESGSWQVRTWDRAAGTHRQVTSATSGTTIARPSRDGRSVHWFEDDGGNEVGQWMTQPFAGGPVAPLLPGAPPMRSSGAGFGPCGTVVVGGAVRSGFQVVVGLAGQGVHRVVRLDGWARVVGVSCDGGVFALEHCEHGEDLRPALRVARVDDGLTVADLWDGPGNSLFAAVFSPVPDDHRVAVLADRSGRARPAVVDPWTWRRTDLVGDLVGDVDLGDWWPDGRSLIVLETWQGRDRLHRVDVATGEVHPLPHAPGTVGAAAVRPDGAVWYHSSSGALPPAIRAVGRAEPVLEPPGPSAPPGTPFTECSFRNDRGDEVHGFLAAPATKPPHATVFLVHGGPHTHNSDRWNPYAQAFVDHGWAVALVNYRGSSGYGRAWVDALVGDPGRPEVCDVGAGRDDLVASGFADPARTAIVGSSWGGYVALLAAGLLPDAWCAVAAVVPIADWAAAYEAQDRGMRSLANDLFGGPPHGREELYRDRSPITWADRVRASVLVYARRNDSRCPLPQVERYVDRLRELGRDVELALVEGGHTAVATEQRLQGVDHILAFLQRTARRDRRRIVADETGPTCLNASGCIRGRSEPPPAAGPTVTV